MLLIDRRSPECGWQPFVDWMNGQGVRAEDARSISIDTGTLVAEVVLVKRRAGRRYLDGSGQVATRTTTVQLTSAPPLWSAGVAS